MDCIAAKMQPFWVDLWRIISFSWQQATAMPTGIHSEFTNYGIDAVTIETYMQPSEVSCVITLVGSKVTHVI